MTFFTKSFTYKFLIVLILTAQPCLAAVELDINEGSVEPISIAINDFDGDDESSIADKVTEVIKNDLQNSGLFKTISKAAFLENVEVYKQPTYSNWRKIDTTAIIAGSVKASHSDKYEIKFQMWDPFAEAQTEQSKFIVSKDQWRRAAHRIADKIYKRLTGDDGYFDSRILFVAESGPLQKRIKRIAMMDQDGANMIALTNGKDLVLTPRFDTKSQRAIYLSYKSAVPRVYIFDLNKRTQRLIGDFPGMSFAPRFAPDGNSAIMSIAKNGSTNIYEIDLDSGIANKITNDQGSINTSPTYSPDGSQIVFNSDRGGSSQLYVMNRDGSNIKRISFEGGNYSTPVWSPRGDYIAFTKSRPGIFYIGVMRPDGSGERILTSSWLSEGPTWSPNGRIIMFERRKKDGSSNLFAIDVTGYHERMIKTPGDASDPAWSPMMDLNS